MKKLVILGGGYGCHEVLAIIGSVNKKEFTFEVLGILDDNTQLLNSEIDGYKVLGGLNQWMNFPDDVYFVIAIGNYANLNLRKKIIDLLQIPIKRFVKLIDPSANILVNLDLIGYGTIIHPNVIIHPLSIIGDFVVISASTVVGVSNIINDYTLLAAGIVTATNISFGVCSFVGSGAIIAPNVNIGCLSFVALGSVVFRDVENGHKVIGNPAKSFEKIDVLDKLLIFNNTRYEFLKNINLNLKR